MNVSGFIDRRFESELSLYRNQQSNKSLRKIFRSGKIPKILFFDDKPISGMDWQVLFRDIIQNQCPLPCEMLSDFNYVKSVDAIIFHLRAIPSVKKMYELVGKRDPTQPWIMFSHEHHFKGSMPKYLPYKTWNGVFNRTLHWRWDADIPYSHGFVVHKKYLKHIPKYKYKPYETKFNFSNKLLAATFISNCHDNSGRLKYIKELQKFIPIHVYGKCGKFKCGSSLIPRSNYTSAENPCYKYIAEKYLFFLAFENGICPDYVSERPYDIMYHTIIPIVYGGAKYADYFPPNSVIDASHMKPFMLATLILKVASDENRFMKYFEWKKHYQTSVIGGSRNICLLCSRLYDPNFYETKIIEDFYDWYVNQSNCIDGNKNPPWLDI